MNNRNTKITRILFATILSMMLVLSILPSTAFAEGSTNAPSKTIAGIGTDPIKNPIPKKGD